MPRSARFVAIALVLAWLGPAAVLASTGLPGPLPERGQLLKVGGGQLSWLGMDIYDASLWTDTGRYEGFADGRTVALSLWYQRSFTRDELLGITNTAWKKLDLDQASRERWLGELRGLWSDVRPGDNVTTVVEAGGATRFYDESRYLGRVDDPAFGPAFLAIWLDPRSVVRNLRVQLLGGMPGQGRDQSKPGRSQ
jgi:hypothetical protein